MASGGRSGAARRGAMGDIMQNDESEQQQQQASEPPKKKFSARHGPGKSIAKHAKLPPKVVEEKPQSSRRTRSKSPAKKVAAEATGKKPEPKRTATARKTPRKKIIDDEPNPEDIIDPFPRPKPPMLVSDKPAVINRYGEKVPAPVDPDQRLRQAINFLSDEGPENCPDFVEKLNALEKFLRKHHPNWEAVYPGGKSQDTETLARRVEWMIWVHRRRLEEGAEEWFVKHQFPNMAKDLPEPGSDRWRALDRGMHFGAPKYPKLQIAMKDAAERKAKEEAEAKPAKAKAALQAARAAAQEQTKSEDWDEPMPRPEVWHRKEADAFPFGETPYMEAMMSKQIYDDLARGKQGTGWYIPLFKATIDWFRGNPEDWSSAAPGPWKLPDLTEEEYEKGASEFNAQADMEFQKSQPDVATKRKAMRDAVTEAHKRPRL